MEKTVNYGGLELDKDYSTCPHYPVVQNTIDNLCLSKCELIKVDVEGMELAVLESGIKTIEKLNPVLIVEDDRAQKSEELRRFIKALGYTIYLQS